MKGWAGVWGSQAHPKLELCHLVDHSCGYGYVLMVWLLLQHCRRQGICNDVVDRLIELWNNPQKIAHLGCAWLPTTLGWGCREVAQDWNPHCFNANTEIKSKHVTRSIQVSTVLELTVRVRESCCRILLLVFFLQFYGLLLFTLEMELSAIPVCLCMRLFFSKSVAPLYLSNHWMPSSCALTSWAYLNCFGSAPSAQGLLHSVHFDWAMTRMGWKWE